MPRTQGQIPLPETYRSRAYSQTGDEVDRGQVRRVLLVPRRDRPGRPPARFDHERDIYRSEGDIDELVTREPKPSRERGHSPPDVPAVALLPNDGQEERAEARVPAFMRETKVDQGPLNVVKERAQSPVRNFANRLPTYAGRSTKGEANIR